MVEVVLGYGLDVALFCQYENSNYMLYICRRHFGLEINDQVEQTKKNKKSHNTSTRDSEK